MAQRQSVDPEGSQQDKIPTECNQKVETETEKKEPEVSHLDHNCLVLTRHLLSGQQTTIGGIATGDLSLLLNAIQFIVKTISAAAKRLCIDIVLGTSSRKQIVKRFEDFADQLFVNMLSDTYATCMLASRLNEDVYVVEEKKQGKYVVIYDPLEGRSNHDPYGVFSTTFSVYSKRSTRMMEKEILLPGTHILIAGYAIYGSSTSMVISFDKRNSVDLFTLDPTAGDFQLMKSNIKIPHRGTTYTVNEQLSDSWNPVLSEFFMKRKKNLATPHTCLYSGTLTADLHYILLKGGIFCYPATKESPLGKLSLMHKAAPMAFIIENAGGKASDGERPILKIVPEKIHHITPVFMGSTEEVEELLQLLHNASRASL